VYVARNCLIQQSGLSLAFGLKPQAQSLRFVPQVCPSGFSVPSLHLLSSGLHDCQWYNTVERGRKELAMSSESAQYHVVASPVYSHGDAATSTSMVSKDPGTPRFSERYLLPILYLTIFLFLYGENIQPAPRTQIYELVICRRLHGGDENIVLDANICKSPDVQEELAFLKGMERLLGIFPSNINHLYFLSLFAPPLYFPS